MNPLSTFSWDDVKLDPWPIPAGNILGGSPDATGALVFMTPDKTSCSGIWQCLPGQVSMGVHLERNHLRAGRKGRDSLGEWGVLPDCARKDAALQRGAQLGLDHRGNGAQVLLPAVRPTPAALKFGPGPEGEGRVVARKKATLGRRCVAGRQRLQLFQKPGDGRHRILLALVLERQIALVAGSGQGLEGFGPSRREPVFPPVPSPWS